ncbi:MAG TPA: hypothetical protein VJ326_01725 [Thermoplasmata archaeon]|nr:hypothetical protein [Thermoplasmata archaeon]
MDLPLWALYGVGTAAILVGFMVFHRWLQGLTGRRAHQPEAVLGAAVVAFLVGSGTIAVAIAIDNEALQVENRRIFTYDLSLHTNATGPYRLYLPSPEDRRLFPALDERNGTSTLRVNTTGPRPLIEVFAIGNVSFAIRYEFIGLPFNTSLSRTTPGASPSSVIATLELSDPAPGATSAAVDLDIVFSEFCRVTHLTLIADVDERVGAYPGLLTVGPC